MSNQQLTIPSMQVIILTKDEIQNVKFETTLMQAVDDSFLALGFTVKDAIYRQLESAFGIKKQEIPLKTEAFANSLAAIFGQASKTIEIRIIKELHGKTGFACKPKKDLVFTEYLTELQRYLEAH